MTNAEKIRNMNNEQLLEFLMDFRAGKVAYEIYPCNACEENENPFGYDCGDCLKHWLGERVVERNPVTADCGWC